MLERALHPTRSHSASSRAIHSRQLSLYPPLPLVDTPRSGIQAALEKERGELEKQYDALAGEMEPLRIKKEEAQKKREPHAQALAALRSKATLARNEAQMLEDKVTEGAEERAAAQAELEAHVSKTAASREALERCTAQISSLSAQLQAAQAAVAEGKGAEGRLVDEERAALAKLEEGRATRTSASSRGALMGALMDAKSSGRIPGIIGRLGSLGTVAKEYDVAASTAGGQLDSVVVEDGESAKACVALLREKKLGVATFIILSRQVEQLGHKLDARFDAPAGSRRLYDLIRVADPAHRAAFLRCFGNTLVCEGNKEVATKIALGGSERHRVVTLDGAVIEPSGTLSGGGKPISGRIGPSAADGTKPMSDKEIAALQKAADTAGATLRSAREAVESATTAARGLQREVAKVTTESKKLQVQMDAADATKAALEARLQRAAGAGELTDAEKARADEIAAELSGLDKEIGKAAAKVEAADGVLAALEEEVMGLGGVRLRAQKSKVEDLQQSAKRVEDELSKVRATAETTEKSVGKLRASLVKAQGAVSDLEKKAAQVEADFAPLRQQAVEVQSMVTEMNESLGEKEAAMEEKIAEVRASACPPSAAGRVGGCARAGEGARGCARVCEGARGCARAREGVRGCAREQARLRCGCAC